MINKAQFEKFVLDPGQLNLATIPELEKLMEAFPYCQATQLLYVKNLYKEHNIHFNQQLRVAAAYAGDRGLLKKLLETKSEEEVYQPSPEEVNMEKESPVEGEAREKDEAGEPADDLPLRQKTEETEPKQPDSSIKEYGVFAEREASEGLSADKEEPTGKADSEADKTGRDEPPEQEKYLELGYPYIEDESPEQEPEVAKTPSEHRRKELEKLKVQLHELRLEREKIEKVIREEKNRKAKAKSTEVSQKQDRKDAGSRTDEKKKFSEKKSTEIKGKPESRQTNRSEEQNNNEEGRSQGAETVKKGKKTSEKSKKELIDKFIKEEPSIRKGAASFYDPTEAARKSIMQSDDIATETLARLYLKQGKVLQAIKIYEKLSLKFPEKSGYFARQIQEIKKTNK